MGPADGVRDGRGRHPVKGQYTDAEGKCRVEALLFEEFGAMSAGVEELLRRVAEVAGRKLTWWQYDRRANGSCSINIKIFGARWLCPYIRIYPTRPPDSSSATPPM